MDRSRIAFVLLVLLISTTSIDANDNDSSTSSSSSLATTRAPSTTVPLSAIDSESLLEKYATPATATSTVRSTYRNWVGPWSLSSDTSCYREAHIMDTCPSNFDRNEATNTCWTECPMEFPVECGMECIRQNSDCGLEVASKVSAVAMAVIGTATFGVKGPPGGPVV